MAKGDLGLLSGEALDAFISVPMESAHNYDPGREALLARFLVNADTYRLPFRSSQRGTGAGRADDYNLAHRLAGNPPVPCEVVSLGETVYTKTPNFLSR